jgi:hypothetical protein
MKKISALLPVALLTLTVFAMPATADEGTPNSDGPVADPGIAALHGAFDAFRAARAAESACRGAAMTDDCKTARSQARSIFQTVRADAVVAHQQFNEKLQTWKDAKTPEAKAAIIADLKGQADEALTVIAAHQADITAMRAALEAQLAQLDPKLRDSVLRQADAVEQALRSTNSAELIARLRDVAAKFAAGAKTPGTTTPALKGGTLPMLPPGFVIPSNLPIPSNLLPLLKNLPTNFDRGARPSATPAH